MGTFAKVANMLTRETFSRVQQRTIEASSAEEKKAVISDEAKKYGFSISQNSSKSNLKTDDFIVPRQYQVKIAGKIVPLTGNDREEDKRRILWVSTAPFLENTDFVFLDKAVEAFIIKDRINFLDYRTDAGLVHTANILYQSFLRYLTNDLMGNLVKMDMLISKIKTKTNGVLPFVRIYNRSLPEVDLEASVDTAARYYTKLIVPEIPKAPKTFRYTLTEENGKTVAQKEFKVIRSLRFDFSIGLGINLEPYTISHSSGGALPVTDQGSQFQFVAGGHWYVIKKLNKLNDRFLKCPEERFSLYGGLSIQKALDNYYLGVSYDLWPGVRLIGAAHLYRNQSFKIINNTVAEKASGIQCAGPFFSVNVEPATLGKTIGLFK